MVQLSADWIYLGVMWLSYSSEQRIHLLSASLSLTYHFNTNTDSIMSSISTFTDNMEINDQVCQAHTVIVDVWYHKISVYNSDVLN